MRVHLREMQFIGDTKRIRSDRPRINFHKVERGYGANILGSVAEGLKSRDSYNNIRGDR